MGFSSDLGSIFRDLRFFSYGSVITTYALIVIGGFVAATNSGEACPDWPRCNGAIIPVLSGSVLIEFSHRLATVLASLFILGTLVVAWKNYRESKNVVLLSTLAFGLVFAQALLGMVVVKSDLQPVVVAAHLGLATGVFAVVLTDAFFVRNLKQTVQVPH